MKTQENDLGSLSLEDKLKLAEGIFIKHVRFKQILKRVEYCHKFSKISSEPKCLFIKGLSGAGKTTLGEYYASLFLRYETDEGTVVPVLYVSLLSPAREKSLAMDLLKGIGDPLFDKGTQIDMTHRLIKLIKECKVELIIIDEFQHLIDRDTESILMNSANWIKDLIRVTRVPVVLIGMPWSDKILRANSQLRGRFSTSEVLDPFRWATKERRKEFKKFLQIVEKMLPFKEKSYLYSEEMSFLLFCASNGLLRPLMKVIKRATGFALESGEEKLTLDLLAQAYDEEIADMDPLNGNPFRTEREKLVVPEDPEILELRAYAARKRDKFAEHEMRASEVLCA